MKDKDHKTLDSESISIEDSSDGRQLIENSLDKSLQIVTTLKECSQTVENFQLLEDNYTIKDLFPEHKISTEPG